MNEIKHYTNVLKYLKNFDGEAENYFRMYYTQRCKSLSTVVDLPKQQFSKSVMCAHCGSLWSKNKFQVKINPGRACSKSVKKIIRSCNEYNTISRFRATLMKKSLKNKKNTISLKCSVCSKRTITNCNKPTKLKLKIEQNSELNASVSKKKKKKRKDKTAGLNISVAPSPRVDKKQTEVVDLTPKVIKIKPTVKNLTPLQKIKKMNLNKLSSVLNKKEKPRSSIHDFLKELY